MPRKNSNAVGVRRNVQGGGRMLGLEGQLHAQWRAWRHEDEEPEPNRRERHENKIREREARRGQS